MVDEQIIGEKKFVSLVAFLQVYGITAWPRQYRLKLVVYSTAIAINFIP